MEDTSQPFPLPAITDGEDKSCAFKNRIRKNYRHLRKWAKRTCTNAFRIYDRDIKEFPFAIDFYAGLYHVHYFSDRDEGDEPPASTVAFVNEALASIFGANGSQIYWKMRIRRKRTEQYEKQGDQERRFIVLEHGVKFIVNLHDYLDTGLFLDHRETRQRVASLCKGKHLLNLFAYTCAFSVQAAAAGAASTTSVDLSNTYTEWGRENFNINHFPRDCHVIVRADCLKFLDQENVLRKHYDVIVIDPPTISRSKKMDQMFDIQLDHRGIIDKALKLLSPEGVILFSTNSRRFKFDDSFPNCIVKEITSKTLPIDFHDKKIHRCWLIEKRSTREKL